MATLHSLWTRTLSFLLLKGLWEAWGTEIVFRNDSAVQPRGPVDIPRAALVQRFMTKQSSSALAQWNWAYPIFRESCCIVWRSGLGPSVHTRVCRRKQVEGLPWLLGRCCSRHYMLLSSWWPEGEMSSCLSCWERSYTFWIRTLFFMLWVL